MYKLQRSRVGWWAVQVSRTAFSSGCSTAWRLISQFLSWGWSKAVWLSCPAAIPVPSSWTAFPTAGSLYLQGLKKWHSEQKYPEHDAVLGWQKHLCRLYASWQGRAMLAPPGVQDKGSLEAAGHGWVSLCLCVAQVVAAELERDGFALPVMVLRGWGGRGCSCKWEGRKPSVGKGGWLWEE